MGGNRNRGDGENGNGNAVLEWEWVGMGMGTKKSFPQTSTVGITDGPPPCAREHHSHEIPMGIEVVFGLLMGKETGMGIILMGMEIAYFRGEK